MSSNYIPQKDIIKRVKEYAFRNCRTDIQQSYITMTLNMFDFGFAYFRTEILTKNKSVKNRPCAFACVQNEGNNTLYLLLICSIHNNDDLGTKILNEVISFAQANSYNKITLECDKKLIIFYEKFNFTDEKIIEDEMHYMVKII